MDFYGKKNLWKFILFMVAVLIGGGTLWYTETFLNTMRQQEIRKVERFADAIRSIVNSTSPEDNITFESSILTSNDLIPIIIVDENGNLTKYRNLDSLKVTDTAWVNQRINEMVLANEPIEIDMGSGIIHTIYYENSLLLTKLRFYPIVLLIVISIFVVIAYIAFSNSRKAEQNQVWNGLAKETAHQIGTPLTSLMGWMELLREKGTEPMMVDEMEKDILRLNTITERFSKIGSKPTLTLQSLNEVCAGAVNYLKSRSPSKIEISYHEPDDKEDFLVELNKPLFEWTVENLIRNAIDAIEGTGTIDVRLSRAGKYIRLEVQDSGKGISPNMQRTVFRPGFTTKSRGWGLGLSLAQRIIEEYHNGRIFVAKSELGKGTTFRIQLKK
jgi:nitrogen-specific signal transduction histidine kinase